MTVTGELQVLFRSHECSASFGSWRQWMWRRSSSLFPVLFSRTAAVPERYTYASGFPQHPLPGPLHVRKMIWVRRLEPLHQEHLSHQKLWPMQDGSGCSSSHTNVALISGKDSVGFGWDRGSCSSYITASSKGAVWEGQQCNT